MPSLLTPTILLLLLATSLNGNTEKPPPLTAARTEQTIEGWTIRVDHRLLPDGPNPAPEAPLGQRALALLTAALVDISTTVPPDRLQKLRTIPIVLDLTHGKLTSMQYHPSADWLRENGYQQSLAKCVHIPSAARFADPHHHHTQPWCVLHELAHAYHDQVLTFEEPRIIKAWGTYRDSQKGTSVLHINGRRLRHYALTNHKEFFAEMTESYFGTNDFFPFNRAELKDTFPDITTLLASIWGPSPH